MARTPKTRQEWAAYQRDWRLRNPDRMKAYRERRRLLDPEKAKDYFANWHLKNRYGISLADFREMAARQNDECAICHRKEKLHVDHDHESGALRALLCGNCNRTLGLMREDPELLTAAAEYVRLWEMNRPRGGRERI